MVAVMTLSLVAGYAPRSHALPSFLRSESRVVLGARTIIGHMGEITVRHPQKRVPRACPNAIVGFPWAR
jgi:hypothetical protein